MKALKHKIFNVLIEKITVSEFENWLYNSEEIIENLDNNPYYFDLISINYKNDKWQNEFKNLVKKNYGTDLLILSRLEVICSKIIHSKNINDCHWLISEIIKDYNYETENIVLFDFYSLYSQFDLINLGYMSDSNYSSEAKYISSLFLNKVENFNSLDEKVNALKSSLEKNIFLDRKNNKIKPISNYQNSTLKQKILAFFKKS